MSNSKQFQKFDLQDENLEKLLHGWVSHEKNGRIGAKILTLFEQQNTMVKCSFVEFLPNSHTMPHRHTGIEYIIVLRGSFSDEYGSHKKGELLLYEKDTVHAWKSEDGALLFVVWSGDTVAVENA